MGSTPQSIKAELTQPLTTDHELETTTMKWIWVALNSTVCQKGDSLFKKISLPHFMTGAHLARSGMRPFALNRIISPNRENIYRLVDLQDLRADIPRTRSISANRRLRVYQSPSRNMLKREVKNLRPYPGSLWQAIEYYYYSCSNVSV